jgi:hypothetical protein
MGKKSNAEKLKSIKVSAPIDNRKPRNIKEACSSYIRCKEEGNLR